MSVLPGQPFEVWEVDGLPIVSAPSEIDVANAEELESALLRAAAVLPTFVVDLSSTEFCDSTGLSVLIRAQQRARAEGAEVRLAACTFQVMRVLTVIGADTLFPIFPSVVEAVSTPADSAPTS